MQSQFLNRRALIPCGGAEDGKSAGTSSGKSGTGNSVAVTVSIRSSAESTGRCVKYNTVGRIILHLLDIMQRDPPPPPQKKKKKSLNHALPPLSSNVLFSMHLKYDCLFKISEVEGVRERTCMCMCVCVCVCERERE